MGFLKQSPLLLPLCFFLVSGIFPFLAISADNTNLVYKGCANQKFPDLNGIYSQNLKSLYNSLLSQSAQKPFATTTAGQGQNAITGWYQCRGDLTTDQCSDCVSKIPEMANNLCPNAVSARVQLTGCYLRYEISGFKQISGNELLYKLCGSIKASGTGFDEKRATAFEMMEDGVKSGSSLFYTGTYQSVYVLAQCEGDLGADDCGDCVKNAAQRAVSECGDSISSQIYLQKCYISYRYYPNGVPNPDGPNISSSPGPGTGQNHTQRTAAIAVGGVAALGFLIACLLFAKSLVKKRSRKYEGKREQSGLVVIRKASVGGFA